MKIISKNVRKTKRKYNDQNLGDALKAYCDRKLCEGWAGSTYSRNTTTLNNYILPRAIAKLKPEDVTRDDVVNMVTGMRKEKLSASLIHRAVGLIKQYYNDLGPKFGENPCDGIKAPYSAKLTSKRVLSADEARRLFGACNKIGGNADIIKFAFLTYMRPGEVSTLKYSDWDMKEKTVTIQRTRTNDVKGHRAVTEDGITKTKASTRTIALNDMAEEILQARFLKSRESGHFPSDEYIWPQKSDLNKPIGATTVARVLKKALREAEISKNVTPHGLRHSGITFYAKDRDQFLAISKNAGHSRPSITEDVYTHVLNEHEEAARKSANIMNQVLT